MIVSIDSKKILEMFKGGAKNLQLNREYVDSLNVFPVPDGDTGTNMMLTLNTTLKQMEASDSSNIVSLCNGLSVGALKGARGNSGVILSQIFKGMALVLSEIDVINTKTFARALKKGAEVAYAGVQIPKEGTILTVIRMVADYAMRLSIRNKDFITFFKSILKQGQKVLDDTPNMLPVLKKAGVVDAGGAGLLVIFEGMYNVLAGIEMKEIETPPVQLNLEEDTPDDIHDFENIKFAYCTEFFIVNTPPKTTLSDIDKYRDTLMELGDCVLVIGGLDMVKVHVHTNNPDKVLSLALKIGEIHNVKIDNMPEQFREMLQNKEASKIVKPVGMVAICNGEGLKAIFKELNVDVVIEGGQTMNPSVEDIVEEIETVNAEVVYILPNNKNIIMAAEQAKGLVENCEVVVIPTKDVARGVVAAMNFNPENSIEENEEAMNQAISVIRSGQVTHAVRDTEMDGYNLHDGDIIGIYGNIVAKGKNVATVTKELVAKLVGESSYSITLYYGANTKDEDAELLRDELQEQYPFMDVILYNGGQHHYYYYVAVE
ncbi:MAG TPA: DAK2 domain-containing protein [Clostridia bacterium]|jgi:hypothetical protein|nr:DAK2 domain-containing protein [Clostridia bacterium]